MAHEPTGGPSAGEDEASRLLDRRGYLKLATVAAGTLPLAAGWTMAAVSHRGISFDRVLNAVADLGMDPTGNAPIDDAFFAAIESGTLIEFPAGEYLFTRYEHVTDVERFGIRGLGASRNDVEFMTPEGVSSWFLFFTRSSDVLVENVTFQQRMRTEGGSIGNLFNLRTNLQVHNVEYAGVNTNGSQERYGLVARITDPGGNGLVSGLVHAGPSEFRDSTGGDGASGASAEEPKADTAFSLSDVRWTQRLAGDVEGAALADDAVYLGGGDGTLTRVSRGGTREWSKTAFDGSVEDVVVLSSGDVVAASVDGTVRRFSPDGTRRWATDARVGALSSLAADPRDDSLVAMSATGDLVRLSSSGLRLGTASPHSGDVEGVVVDASGYVYTASDDGSGVKLAANGDETWRYDHPDELEDVAVDAAGNVVFCSDDATVKCVSPSLESLWSASLPAAVETVAATPDGHVIAGGSAELVVFDPNGTRIHSVSTGSQVDSLAFDAAGLVVGTADGRVRFFDMTLPDGGTDGGAARTLRIEAPDEGIVHYTVSAEGSIDATDGATGATDWDTTTTADGRTTVDGWLRSGHADTWSIEGRIVDFSFLDLDSSLARTGTVLLDGVEVDPGTLVGTTLPNEIVIDGTRVDGGTTYAFTVSGDLVKSYDYGSVEASDDLDGSSVSGSVGDDVDAFRFSGKITSFVLDGNADIRFDRAA